MGKDYNKEQYIFSVTDPFGREVKLKTSTWEHHILQENQRTGLEGEERSVKAIIENLAYILLNDPDNSDDKRQKYIDLVDLNAYDKLKAIIVIVDFSTNEHGDLVTVIPKSKVNESTKGGPLYVRFRSTNK